jgi:hypothetical protein
VASRWTLASVLGLRNIRALVHRSLPQPADQAGKPELDDAVAIQMDDARLSDLELVLIRAKEVVGAWRGRLVLAYLPTSERYRFPGRAEVKALPQNQAAVAKLAAELQIPMIDLDPVLAAAGSRLYPKANWPVHFNEDGYRVVADAIAAQLTALGPPP